MIKELTWYEHSKTGEGVAATDVGQLRLEGYKPRQKLGYVYGLPEPGTVPLRIFWHAKRKDHYTVSSAAGIREAKALGYQELAITGHVYPAKRRGTKAIHTMLRGTDYVAATGMRKMARARMQGFKDVRTIGHILWAPASHEAAARDGKPIAGDADGDGVPDDKDKCPHLSIKKGSSALHGCPLFIETLKVGKRTVRRAYDIPPKLARGKPSNRSWRYFDRLRRRVKAREYRLLSCLLRVKAKVFMSTEIEIELAAKKKPILRSQKEAHRALEKCGILKFAKGLPKPPRGTYKISWDWK